jgi:hypothetical protein
MRFQRGIVIIAFIILLPSLSYAGGFFKKFIHQTYNVVKKVGQEVIEKPVRKLKKGDKKEKKSHETGDSSRFQGKELGSDDVLQKVDGDGNELKREYSLDSPYDRGIHNYNRSSRIDSILGLIEFNIENGLNSREEIKSKLKKIENLYLNHLYYGLLSMQEKLFMDRLATYIAADLKEDIGYSAGFVTYGVSEMEFRKLSNSILDKGSRLLWNKPTNFPDIAESFFLLTTHGESEFVLKSSIFLSKEVAMDGWIAIYDKGSKELSIYYLLGEDLILLCNKTILSKDRLGHY